MTLFNTAETLLFLENGILKAPASSLKMQCTASLNNPLPLDHHFYTLNPGALLLADGGRRESKGC